MHRFEGGNPTDGYTYTICFNKSLNNTRRMNGMCTGLDEAERKEYAENAWDGFMAILRWLNPARIF